jgi:hypothetical protein
MVSHDMPVGYATEMNREPELAAGESSDRRLVFRLPERPLRDSPELCGHGRALAQF